MHTLIALVKRKAQKHEIPKRASRLEQAAVMVPRNMAEEQQLAWKRKRSFVECVILNEPRIATANTHGIHDEG